LDIPDTVDDSTSVPEFRLPVEVAAPPELIPVGVIVDDPATPVPELKPSGEIALLLELVSTFVVVVGDTITVEIRELPVIEMAASELELVAAEDVELG
jgi:hypothetical protein